MAYGRRAQWDTIREAAFGTITGSYAALGSALSHNARIVSITNNTDADIYISNDGINNKKKLPAYSGRVEDLTGNKVRDDGLFLPIGEQVSIKHAGVAPTVGWVALEVTYAEGGV